MAGNTRLSRPLATIAFDDGVTVTQTPGSADGVSVALEYGSADGTVASGGDTRFPSEGEKAALAGTSGTPSGTNRYVTEADARAPAAHASTHATDSATDPVTIYFPRGANISSPSGSGTTDCWVVDRACTVLAVKGLIRGATGTTVNATRVRAGSSVDLLASDITLSSADTVTDGGTVQNASLAVGDIVQAKIVSLSGSPTSVLVQINCKAP